LVLEEDCEVAAADSIGVVDLDCEGDHDALGLGFQNDAEPSSVLVAGRNSRVQRFNFSLKRKND
jgi:hypothetical protein